MITGLHVTCFTRHADQMRDFMRDKLGLPATDVGGGWLLFDAPAAEIAAHPTGDDDGGGHGGDGAGLPPQPGVAELSFSCDDLEATMREMRARGVEFTSEVRDEGWGLLARFRMAPDVEVDLYQPRYERHPTRG
ncbi:VOC family protein [Longimicrobium sp.]|uniref:VOC family protein n=1 Tax=Longimicrobium sp. TaxID=2029185 RepID=UPI002E36F88F|nr:VOC family protein [Longimicrobium sp.]HEX6040441.1 VOC family protein [Longimicrobium sp.]